MKVPVSGKVYNQDEALSLAKCGEELLFGTRSEHWAREFEDALARHVGLNRSVALCNSGSSANLLAVAALGLKPGDEVITTACGFPTTVNPIVQCGGTPVFVDVTLPDVNADMEQVEAAVTPRTRAIILAHTLGNPLDLNALMPIVHRYGLTLISDCCDALGTLYANRPVESCGHYATMSFYPAHHISTEEGGAVVTLSEEPERMRAILSYRDWGRACWCKPGHDNSCGKRFAGGCDHKYWYERIGYHLAMTNMQAAIGVAQMAKLPGFIEQRRRNWTRLRENLRDLDDRLMFQRETEHGRASWFGFLIGCRDLDRQDLIAHLESKGIATRPLFAGDLRRHAAYRNAAYRSIGTLPNTRLVDERCFWVGCYHGLNESHMDYIGEQIHAFYGSAT